MAQKVSTISPTPTSVLGCDISKRSIDICLLRTTVMGGCEQDQRPQLKITNDRTGFLQLEEYLAKESLTAVHVCLESTSTYGLAFATRLHQLGHRVSIVNPLRIHHYGKSKLLRHKTDRSDADLIAEFCLREQPVQWIPLDPELLALRDQVRQLSTLTDLRAEQQIRLQDQAGMAVAVRRTTTAILRAIDRQIDVLTKAVKSHLLKHPSLKTQLDLYQSIKGVGFVTGLTILVEMPHLASFDSPRQAAAFAGVAPTVKESGSSVRGRGALSKIGNARVRRMLYMASLSAVQYNQGLKAFATRLRGAGKAKKVVQGAIMRKLVHILYAVAKTGQPAKALYA